MENAKLYSKYQVRNAGGEPLDSGTFVLRPYNRDGTVRDRAAVAALRAYALACAEDDFDIPHNAIQAWLHRPIDHPATQTLNVPQQ